MFQANGFIPFPSSLWRVHWCQWPLRSRLMKKLSSSSIRPCVNHSLRLNRIISMLLVSIKPTGLKALSSLQYTIIYMDGGDYKPDQPELKFEFKPVHYIYRTAVSLKFKFWGKLIGHLKVASPEQWKRIGQKSEEEGKERRSSGPRRRGHVEPSLPTPSKLLLSSPSKHTDNFFFSNFSTLDFFLFVLLRFWPDKIPRSNTCTFLLLLLVASLIFRNPTQWWL